MRSRAEAEAWAVAMLADTHRGKVRILQVLAEELRPAGKAAPFRRVGARERKQVGVATMSRQACTDAERLLLKIRHRLLARLCPLLAQSRHDGLHRTRPLLGVKQT